MLKKLLRRYRAFMQAEIMAELAKQNALARQMEAALLTIALAGERAGERQNPPAEADDS